MSARARLVVPLLALIAVTAWAADPIGHWQIAGPLKVTTCRDGDCGSYDATSVTGTFAGSADGSFVSSPLLAECSTLPNLTGRWSPGSRAGRFKLVPTNGRDVRKALADCNEVKLRGGIRGWFQPNADGVTGKGQLHFRGRANLHGTTSSFVATARFTATRTSGSPSGAFLE